MVSIIPFENTYDILAVKYEGKEYHLRMSNLTIRPQQGYFPSKIEVNFEGFTASKPTNVKELVSENCNIPNDIEIGETE